MSVQSLITTHQAPISNMCQIYSAGNVAKYSQHPKSATEQPGVVADKYYDDFTSGSSPSEINPDDSCFSFPQSPGLVPRANEKKLQECGVMFALDKVDSGDILNVIEGQESKSCTENNVELEPLPETKADQQFFRYSTTHNMKLDMGMNRNISDLSSNSSQSSKSHSNTSTGRRSIFKQFWSFHNGCTSSIDFSSLSSPSIMLNTSNANQRYEGSPSSILRNPYKYKKALNTSKSVRFSNKVTESTYERLLPSNWLTVNDIRRAQKEFQYHLTMYCKGNRTLLNGKGLLSPEVTRAIKLCYSY